MNLWVIFITGLTVGGLTCLAVQGGLLASVIAAKEEDDLEKGDRKKHTLLPTLAFLGAKLAVYTLLGFLLGAFGGAIGISSTVQIGMQFLAGLYMIVIALNLLNVHPIFRYAVIQPPRFLTRHIRKQSKNKDLFAPALLGAMTIFIPCGTTLAMEALAISSGNAFIGAAIMLVFVLGTTPLFFGIGWLTTVLGDNYQRGFLKLAAIAVLYLGITAMNSAIALTGSSFTLDAIGKDIWCTLSICRSSQETSVQGTQVTNEAMIEFNETFYSPSSITVKAGSTVKLNLVNKAGQGCIQAFTIPKLGIQKIVALGASETIEFIAPREKGELLFMCSMGMYRGVINVI